MRLLAFILFILGLLVTGVLGTETALLFYWPGCLVLGLAGLVAGGRWKMRIHFAPSDACLGAVVLLTLYFATRAVLSPVVGYAREDLFMLLGCFVTYILTCTVASHPRWRIAIMALLLLLTIGNLAVGFIHFSGNWTFHVVPGFARTFGEGGRIGGFFINSNHLAAFLSCVLFLCLGLICFGRGGASAKLLLGFVGIASSIGMALTESRGALVGLAVGVAVFAAVGLWIIWKTQRHIFGRLIVMVFVLVGLVGSVLYIVNAEYLKRRAHANPLTGDVRQYVWQAAREQNALQPVTGAGSRMFYDYCITLRPEGMAGYHEDPLFAHNEYLQTLADYGVVGLGLLALVALLHVGNGLRFVHWFATSKFLHTGMLMSNTLAFATGALGALAATMAHAVFEFHFHVAATAIMGALVLGLLANPGFDLEDAKRTRIPGVRPFAKVLLVLASLAMIGGAVWLGPADWFAAKAGMAAVHGDMQGRVEGCSAAVQRDPFNATAWYQRGLAWIDQWKPTLPEGLRTRLLDKAAADLEQAVRLNPQHYLYATALVDVYDRMGREADALRMANVALKAAPWHEEARLTLAMHLHRWRHFEEAEQAYLWARDARKPNRQDEFNWVDNYQRLLKDAASVRVQP